MAYRIETSIGTITIETASEVHQLLNGGSHSSPKPAALAKPGKKRGRKKGGSAMKAAWAAAKELAAKEGISVMEARKKLAKKAPAKKATKK